MTDEQGMPSDAEIQGVMNIVKNHVLIMGYANQIEQSRKMVARESIQNAMGCELMGMVLKCVNYGISGAAMPSMRSKK
jgi:hypothetical protein